MEVRWRKCTMNCRRTDRRTDILSSNPPSLPPTHGCKNGLVKDTNQTRVTECATMGFMGSVPLVNYYVRFICLLRVH